ncbi:ankyrin repeat-containing protein [Reticulomyxa filosa]|uniref:Ankyrin repeat-containing protein n=1 Tax=Reticulomyxa filosa TaxID=46433 RepID=X6LZ71_RETFI|nr:ankyrin repeat-containing protein [Reticulomyxa filosa]|eukprot:ETO06035.1 ankyrin repeat-containing protein [Reticulomyxa filosa]
MPLVEGANASTSASSTNDSNNNSNNVSTVTLSNAVTTTQERNRFDGKESERSLDLKHELGGGGGHFRHESDDTMSESSLTSDTTTLTAISEAVTLDSQDEDKTHAFSNAPVATAATQHNAPQNVNLSSRLVFHTKTNNPNTTSANVATQKDPRGKT